VVGITSIKSEIEEEKDYNIIYYRKNIRSDSFTSYILGVDVGGTNTNLGVSGVRNGKPNPLFSLNYKSQQLKSIETALNNVIDYSKEKHGLLIKKACIAASGPVSEKNDYCKPTHIDWDINAKKILKRTGLSSLLLLNDFDAIGYGINLLKTNNEDDIKKIRPGMKRQKSFDYANKAVIGAGTGLGKNILVYDNKFSAYIPHASEGGHGDFPAQDEPDYLLVDFIKERTKADRVSYEDIISGSGIETIYDFLKEYGGYEDSKYSVEIAASNDKVPLIAKYKHKDKTSRETFKMYTAYYARCAKNFVLDTLSRGGLYIAGGVASKNPGIFSTREFIKEFENSRMRSELLKSTPVYVLKNYDVSIYGASLAAIIRKDLAITR